VKVILDVTMISSKHFKLYRWVGCISNTLGIFRWVGWISNTLGIFRE